ncbi:MAG TPA: tRNA (guanosine(46)-N7)-methyltransferase TrmB [Polyangia bacterium]|nr:tRNA (guanosine(46)-N7)-methyltransferase TrmB [Polyangia bacterium]
MRVRHHVNPLRSPYWDRARAATLSLPTDRDVEAELGCADARFLFERAPQHPESYFLGLEIREPLVDEVNRKAAELGLPNLRAVFCNINIDLPTLVPNASLARMFINFPDPWFKRRHQKRRLMNEELVDVLHAKLRVGGELFFQSDVFDLALDAMAVLEGAPERFANVDGPWSFVRDNRYGARSQREVRCEDRGVRIWRMCYRRIGA